MVGETKGNVCSATDPSGGEVSNSAVGSQTATWGDQGMHRVMKVEADQAGDYRITCSETFVVADDLAIGGLTAMAIGGGLACLSVVLVVIGFVLRLVKRKR